MALLPRTKRAAEKKAAVKKKHLSKKAQKNASKAQTRAQKAMASIGPLAAVAAEQARERAAGYYEDYAPVVQKNVREGLKKGGERFGDLASNLNGDYAKKAKQFRGDFEDDYLPRARNTASAASDTAAAALTAALAAARKEWDKGAGDIQKAATASPKKKSVFGKLLLVTGLAAAVRPSATWCGRRPVRSRIRGLRRRTSLARTTRLPAPPMRIPLTCPTPSPPLRPAISRVRSSATRSR